MRHSYALGPRMPCLATNCARRTTFIVLTYPSKLTRHLFRDVG